MSIRTKEAEVPSEFPPARLFLDDIEEIVRILCELAESPKFSKHFTAEELELKVTLSIGNKECDDILDLPKISRRTKTSTLGINVSKGPADTSLTIRRFGTFWRSYSFTRENTWKAFHKLQPLFKARSTLWRSFIHSIPWWLLSISGLIIFGLFTPTIRFLPRLATALEISEGLAFIFVLALCAGKFLHTTVILRNSWEPSALRQELLHRIPLVVITAVLTLLSTLLGFYLKHKYWP